MKFFNSIFLSILFLLTSTSAFSQGGSIVRTATTNVMDPNGDGYITVGSQVPFSNDGYYSDEFEISMFGLPKLGDGDVTGDSGGANCGITDLIPDYLNAVTRGYSVYAKLIPPDLNQGEISKKLMFRFRVGDDNSSVESWSILIDVDGLFGPKPVAQGGDPDYTAENPGFELDITLIKRNNAGVYVYNIDGVNNCPDELLFYPIQSHFQISLDGGGGTCGDPDYYYDFYVPFDPMADEFNAATNNAYNLTSGLSMRYAAVTNQSASCAMGGTLSDVSGLDNTDPLYDHNFTQAFIDIIENQCGTPIDSLVEGASGFDANKVSPPIIDEDPPIVEGQTSIAGATVESNIWVELKIYSKNIGTRTWPTDSALARETHHAYSSGPLGTTWDFQLDDPLQAYDSIVVRTAFSENGETCGSVGNNTSTSTSVTISKPNKKPIAIPQNLVTLEDTQLALTLKGKDPNKDAITFSIVTGPKNGSLTTAGTDSTWIYLPNLNYFGKDSLAFKVTEYTQAALDSVNYVYFNVTPVNDAPVVTGNANPITYTIVQSSLIIDSSIGVADVDDVNMESAIVSIVGNLIASQDVLAFTNTTKITGVYSNGILTLTGSATKAEYADALASVKYVNISNRPTLTTRTVNFVVNDGNLNSAPFSRDIIFNIGNYPPEITSDPNGELHLSTQEDVPLTNQCLMVTDPENQTVSITSVTSLTNHGTTVPTGLCFNYTPTPNFNGEERVEIIVCDNGSPAGCDTVIVVITVQPVNDAPTAENDIASTNEETPVMFNILSNDTDIDNALDPASVILSTTTVATKGSFVYNGGGSLSFTPFADFFGTVAIDYTVKDVSGAISNTASITITVTSVNDLPNAGDDTFTTDEDVTMNNKNILDNDIDVDNALTVTQFTVNGTNYAAGSSPVTIPGGIGTIVINADGSFTFDPAQNYFNNAPVAIATYTVIENGGTATDVATLNIQVDPINDPPVGGDDTGASNNFFTTPEDDPITLADNANVLDNDVDPDGDILSVTGFTVNTTNYPITTGGSTSATINNQGTVTIYSNGDLTFTPVSGFNGNVFGIFYNTSDGNGGTGSATITIVVTPVNDLPDAVDDTFTTDEDVTMNNENVLTNDTDADHALIVDQFTVNGTNYAAGSSPVTIPGGIGTIVINANGSFTFDPAQDYFNNAPVAIATYTVIENGGTATDVATLSIQVNPLNDPPVGGNDIGATNNFFTTPEDDPITLADNANVLDNDVDPDGDILSVTGFTVNTINYPVTAGGSASAVLDNIGTVTIHSNGDLTFTSVLNYNGTLPFTYTSSDGNGGVGSATVSILVTQVNDNPEAVNDVRIVLENTTLTGNVLTNDRDIDGHTITVIQFTVSGDGTTYAANATAIITGIGSININTNGGFTFIPETNYDGPVPNITYTISDGNGGTASAVLMITVVNVIDYPIAADDFFSTSEDVTLNTANVLTNDTPELGFTLAITGFMVAGDVTSYGAGAIANISGVGSVQIAANGSLVFDPDQDYRGSVPLISYTANDGTGSTGATVTITITPVNDAVIAVNDSYTIAEDFTLSSENVLANDSDVDLDPLIVTQFVVPGDITVYNAGQTATISGKGTLKINANGSFTFDPDLNYTNTNFELMATYTASDGPTTDDATLSIRITPVNDDPVTGNDTGADAFTTPEDDPITLAENKNVLDNDSDPDGDVLSVTEFSVSSGTYVISPGSSSSAVLATIGTVTIHSNGDLEFVPVANYNGNVPPITYTMSDGNSGSATASVSIIVTPVNDPVVAANDSYTTVEDINLTSENVLANDSDVDLNTLTVTQFVVPGDANVYNVGQTATISGIGTLLMNANGGFTFDPNLNYNNTSAVLVATYTVSDGLATAQATLSIRVTPVNDNPVGNDTSADAFSTAEDDAITLAENINVLGNDSDPDGDVLTVTGFTVNSNPTVITVGSSASAVLSGIGTVTLYSNGNLEFVPLSNYNGSVPTITYTTSDGNGGSASAAVSIVVTPLNDAPVADNDNFTTPEEITLNGGNVLANDSDVDLNPLTLTQFIVPGDVTVYSLGQTATITGIGSLLMNANGSFTFIPNLNYSNSIPVLLGTYTLSDGQGGTDVATLNVRVTPINDNPVGGNDTGTGASNDPFTAVEDDPILLSENANVLSNDADPDGDNLTVTGFVVNSQTYTINAGSSASATILNVGTVTIHNDGRLEFVPLPNYNGTVPDITYTISDGNGGTGTATVIIIVTPVNDPPVITESTPLTLSTQEDTPLPFCFNYQDIDGNSVIVGAFDRVSNDLSTLGTTSITGSTACLQFNPELNFNSGPTSSDLSVWRVNVCDNAITPACVTVTIQITVTPVNDAPFAGNDVATTNEDVSITKNILQNDTDVDAALDPNNKINPSTIDLDPTTVVEEKSITLTGQGTFTVNALGDVTFAPSPNFEGPTVIINYSVKDFGGLASAPASITVTINGINDAPVINPFNYSPPEHFIYEDSVFGPINDSDGICISATDVDGDVVIYNPNPVMVQGGGSMVLRTDNFNFCYIFTPAPNYNGQSIWQFTVGDGMATSNAQISILVLPVNDPPVAVDDFLEAQAGTSIEIDAVANDLVIKSPFDEFYDIYAARDSTDTLSIIKIQTFGSIASVQNNKISYTPDLNYVDKTDSIKYWVRDKGGLIDSAVVYIEVGPAKFHIYEALSPNGDEINDYWRVDGIEQDPKNLVRIFDRYGNLVFETKGYSNENNHWTGQSNHGVSRSSLPDGTYYYTINIDLEEDNQGERLFSGFIVLKRK